MGIILEAIDEKGRVTADDVRAMAPDLPFKRSVLGAAFQGLLRSHRIKHAGYTRSRVPSNHGRILRVYEAHPVKTCLEPAPEASA